MYEIRIHGRGGQGAVMAGGILAAALVNEGKYVVAVPSSASSGAARRWRASCAWTRARSAR